MTGPWNLAGWILLLDHATCWFRSHAKRSAVGIHGVFIIGECRLLWEFRTKDGLENIRQDKASSGARWRWERVPRVGADRISDSRKYLSDKKLRDSSLFPCPIGAPSLSPLPVYVFFWFSHPLPFPPHLPPLMHHPTKTVVVLGASYAGKFNNSCHVSVSTKVKPPFVIYRTQSSSPARGKNSRGLEGCCY